MTLKWNICFHSKTASFKMFCAIWQKNKFFFPPLQNLPNQEERRKRERERERILFFSLSFLAEKVFSFLGGRLLLGGKWEVVVVHAILMRFSLLPQFLLTRVHSSSSFADSLSLFLSLSYQPTTLCGGGGTHNWDEWNWWVSYHISFVL